MDMKKLQRAYSDHAAGCRYKRDAAGNPVEMRLTFEEWLHIWVESGKLHLRGCRRGQYVMSRTLDLGHYEVGNVFIQETSNNVRDAQRGKKLSDEQRAAVGAAKSKPCTIDGVVIYSSYSALRKSLGQGKNGTASPHFRYV